MRDDGNVCRGGRRKRMLAEICSICPRVALGLGLVLEVEDGGTIGILRCVLRRCGY